jgi:ABC-2 type transport system permease protein
MHKKYNQLTALIAISKATLLAILKNPSSIFFSLLFPLVFVWIFGSFRSGGGPATFQLVVANGSDTTNPFYQAIKQSPLIRIRHEVSYDKKKLDESLQEGNMDAVIYLEKPKGDTSMMVVPKVKLTVPSLKAGNLMQLQAVLESIAAKVNMKLNSSTAEILVIDKEIYKVKEHSAIDRVLPGQIGFSILFSTLFGIAFTFYNLREQLVLKRFFASPVNKLNILVGVGLSRIVFQLLNVVVLILVGRYWLHFNLPHGFSTFMQMLLLSTLMLLVLMGVGLIFSSIAKSDAIIPMFINLFALPQMLLSGTFFPIEVFPGWMQTLCKFFPLTHFNLAMKSISYEGMNLLDCWQNIGVIGIWGVGIYFLVYKIFRWE